MTTLHTFTAANITAAEEAFKGLDDTLARQELTIAGMLDWQAHEVLRIANEAYFHNVPEPIEYAVGYLVPVWADRRRRAAERKVMWERVRRNNEADRRGDIAERVKVTGA
jgi:hypothetical protein